MKGNALDIIIFVTKDDIQVMRSKQFTGEPVAELLCFALAREGAVGLMVSFKAILSPGLIAENSNGIGQVKAAAVRLHREAKNMGAVYCTEYFIGQATGFWPEYEAIPGLKTNFAISLLAFSADGEQPARRF